MSYTKISQLPLTTTSTTGDFLVKNNSGETTTSKVELTDVLGLTTSGSNNLNSAGFLTLEGTTASTTNSIAIGNGAEATSPSSIAIGYRAGNDNRDGGRDGYISIGYDTNAVQYSIAMGYGNVNAIGAYTIAMGNNSNAAGNGAVAIGQNSSAYSTYGVALGNYASEAASGQNYGIAIGHGSLNQVQEGIAIGYNAFVKSSNQGAICIGSGVQSKYDYTLHTTNTHTEKIQSFGVVTGGSVSGNVVVDCSLGTIYTFTLGGNITQIDFQNLTPGQILEFIIDNTTYNVTGNALIDGVSGYVYAKNGTIAPSNNSITHYTATFDGTRLFLDEEGQFSVV